MEEFVIIVKVVKTVKLLMAAKPEIYISLAERVKADKADENVTVFL
ncbi:hypothetical protein [Methanosarcina barkeri]|nr:hypothetical protein [Methanosarcina barkeri]